MKSVKIAPISWGGGQSGWLGWRMFFVASLELPSGGLGRSWRAEVGSRGGTECSPVILLHPAEWGLLLSQVSWLPLTWRGWTDFLFAQLPRGEALYYCAKGTDGESTGHKGRWGPLRRPYRVPRHPGNGTKTFFFKAAPSPTVKHLGTFFPEGTQSYNSRPQFCTANSLWLSGFSLVLQRYFFLQLCMPRIMLFYRISELMICEYFIIKYLKQSEYYGETHYQTHQVRLIFFFIFTLDFFPPRIKTYRSS